MNENNGKPDPEQGLYRKYDVTRLNDPAGKHKDCTYYILDLDHDPHSVAALMAYAKSCEAQYPTLAFDLRHTAAATARKLSVALPEASRVERGEAVNLASNIVSRLDTGSYDTVTDVGVKILAEAVLKMDAALAPSPQLRKEPK